MTLIAGLGNPGGEYALTRHNAGFFVIDQLLAVGGYDRLGGEAKFFGELYKSGQILLLKPTTFMNLSGKSLAAVANFYKPDKIIVIHDDIDLPLGGLRFKIGGSSGGHNGIKSIDSTIGADYYRIRVGVGAARGGSTISHVLGTFNKEELELIAPALKNAQIAALKLASGGELKDISALTLNPNKAAKTSKKTDLADKNTADFTGADTAKTAAELATAAAELATAAANFAASDSANATAPLADPANASSAAQNADLLAKTPASDSAKIPQNREPL